MKLSIYTSFIKLSSNRTLAYNALSDKFIIINNTTSINDPVKFVKNSQGQLRKQLLECNILIDNTIDEILNLKELIDKIDNNNSNFFLNINPTLECNFNCWYCYETHNKGIMSQDTLSHTLKFIYKTLQNNQLKTFHLSFFGGEPLIGFDDIIKPILEYSKTECYRRNIQLSYGITSNGYLLNDKIISYLQHYNGSFQITLDGDKDSHNRIRFPKGGGQTYDIIIKNIIALTNANISVNCRINYTMNNIMNLHHILDSFSNEHINKQLITFDFQQVWQDQSLHNNNQDTRTIINSIIIKFAQQQFNVSCHKLRDAIRNSCYADKRNHLLINFDGSIYLCTARDFNQRNISGHLLCDGSIVWKDDALEKRMAIKLDKDICQKCRIAPLCGGGCRQVALESNKTNNCIFSYSEADKDQIVLDRLEYILSKIEYYEGKP